MNHDWLFTETDSVAGRYQNVTHIRGLKFNDFVREFGIPHKTEERGKFDRKHQWNFELFNGVKFSVYFDSGDYVFDKMQRLDLKKYGPVEMSEVDYMTVMGMLEALAFLRMYFIELFGVNDAYHRLNAFGFLFDEGWKR